jgi:hypothetical protein
MPIVLGFRDDLQGSKYSGICSRDMYKKDVFTFYHCFLELLPTFFFEFWCNLKGPWHLVHVWKPGPKTHHFWVLWLFSRAILPTFCGSNTIYKPHDSWYLFERHDQTLTVFAFYWRFHEVLPIVLGFLVRFYKAHDTRYMFERMTKNSLFSIFYGCFCELCP